MPSWPGGMCSLQRKQGRAFKASGATLALVEIIRAGLYCNVM